MEIAPGVQQVTVGQGAFLGVYPPNVYLVTGRDRAAFIDTAYGKDEETKAHLECWEAQGKPKVAAIILTHRHGDHIGGAGRLRSATGGAIASSPVEKQHIEQAMKDIKVGKVVADGETLDLGGATLEFIHAPGHTLGSLCILYREQGVLFTGDTILGSSTTHVSPEDGDMAAYIESLRKLLNYDAALIAPGHGPIIKEPHAKIRQLIEHRLDRERQIVGLIQAGSRTVEELFTAIYPELSPGLHDAARSQIRAHLVKLERDGKVASVRGQADAFKVTG